MASKVYLHIGTMKSATTYLQELAAHNADRLAAQGLFWPSGDLAFPALADLLGRDENRPTRSGAWERLVRAIAQHSGPAVFSNELLAPIGRHAVRRIVQAFEPTAVEVVVTVRDLGRVIPSHWQTTLKNGNVMPWTEFASSVCAEPAAYRGASRRHDVGSWFWRRHDVPAILERWSGHVPMRRCSVVTVPAAGGEPSAVWHRFTAVLRLASHGFEPPAHDNTSVGAWSAELLRRFNETSPDLERAKYRWGVKEALVRRGLAGRAASEPSFGLSPEQFDWVIGRAARIMHGIRESGAAMFGDLDDLCPTPPAANVVDPEAATDADLLSAAFTGLGGLVDAVAELQMEKERSALAAERARDRV